MIEFVTINWIGQKLINGGKTWRGVFEWESKNPFLKVNNELQNEREFLDKSLNNLQVSNFNLEK